MRLHLVHSFLLLTGIAHASVAVYGPLVQQPYGAVIAASASHTGATTYNDVTLTSPPLSSSPPPTSFDVQLQTGVDLGSTSSVTQKTWADQTFADASSSDERPVGTVGTQAVDCDQTNNICNVKVPAPGTVRVFLPDQAPAESNPGPTVTFPTTARTKLRNTAAIDPSALATSDVNKGIGDALAGTSQGGGINGAFGLARALPSVGALVALLVFVCLESVLSFAVTGNSPLSLVSGTTKNAL